MDKEHEYHSNVMLMDMPKEILNASMKDIYTDDEGVSALTLRFSYVSADRTLSKQELQPTIDTVAAALESVGLKVKA